MKNNTQSGNKSFHSGKEIAQHDTCTGKKPIWSDNQEAIWKALAGSKKAQGNLAELLHLESLREDNVEVPSREIKKLRERSLSALKSAMDSLEDIEP